SPIRPRSIARRAPVSFRGSGEAAARYPAGPMPVSPALAKDPVVVGPLGGLALSAVRAASPMMMVRAVRWYRDLARLGLHIPFFIVHDFGLLYAAPKEQLEIGPRPGLDAVLARVPRATELLGTYRSVLGEVAQ